MSQNYNRMETVKMKQSRFEKGLETLKKITDSSGSAVVESLKDIAPDLADWIINFSYGDVLSRNQLDLKSRQLATVDIRQAEVQQQLAEYRQLVLSAVREVEDALIRETKIREHIGAVKNQLEAAKSALKEAGTRYLNGLNDYLPVLTQILSVQGLESDLIQRQADLLIARVSLYRAIGGSWADELSSPEKTNNKR